LVLSAYLGVLLPPIDHWISVTPLVRICIVSPMWADMNKRVSLERPKPNSDFEIVASESIEDKSSVLKVEASLKASFLSGLVEVEGSAKYLNDQKTSKNQARVTLTYKTTTKFKELSMNHLGRGNMKHQYVFDKGIATHVVTGILYGAQAFFVFDREVSEKENHQDIQGNLKVMIKKNSLLSNVEKFSCKFHGDFSLEKNPVTFQDAVEVYKSLPKLLGANGENAVPVKVWLLPLASLDSAAALPSIRGGGEEEAVLAEILKKRHSSPFNSEKLKEWMDCKEREICILKTFTNMMKNTKIVPSRNGVHEEILSAENAVCFAFTSLGRDEPYLSALSNYLKGTPESDDPQDPAAVDIEKQQWYASKEVADEMRKKAKLFNDFAEANKENKNVKFLTVGLTNETQKGSSIYLYKDVLSVGENFDLPSLDQTSTF
uniref:Uncharacterized protein n=1 Tax=Mastacembelus armatus TaxID=205130 RepID=A0A3Q3MI92_9TELE